MYDIIIIGAGPAGLTAAIYGVRAGKKVLVLEAKSYGGQIINVLKIDNYPALPHVSGVEYATTLYEQALELGAEIKFEKAIDMLIEDNKKIITTTKEKYEAKAVIIATGNDKRKLRLENEEKLEGKGISYCATCDGMFYKDKDVAVVGGGDTALDDAMYLSDIVNKVYLIHRREEFRGIENVLEELKKKNNVEIITNTYVTKLIGAENLEAIETMNNEGNANRIEVSGLFVAIGQVPETGYLPKEINTNSQRYVEAGEDTKTNIEGVFVAGDVRTKELRQLTTAAADGSMAAVNACKYIRELNN